MLALIASNSSNLTLRAEGDSITDSYNMEEELEGDSITENYDEDTDIMDMDEEQITMNKSDLESIRETAIKNINEAVDAAYQKGVQDGMTAGLQAGDLADGEKDISNPEAVAQDAIAMEKEMKHLMNNPEELDAIMEDPEFQDFMKEMEKDPNFQKQMKALQAQQNS